MRIYLSPQAEDDIADITHYIALDNPYAAQDWYDELKFKFEMLSEFPLTGVDRSQLRTNLRIFPFKKYIILYQIKDKQIEIIRVVHSARDLENLF